MHGLRASLGCPVRVPAAGSAGREPAWGVLQLLCQQELNPWVVGAGWPSGRGFGLHRHPFPAFPPSPPRPIREAAGLTSEGSTPATGCDAGPGCARGCEEVKKKRVGRGWSRGWRGRGREPRGYRPLRACALGPRGHCACDRGRRRAAFRLCGRGAVTSKYSPSRRPSPRSGSQQQSRAPRAQTPPAAPCLRSWSAPSCPTPWPGHCTGTS